MSDRTQALKDLLNMYLASVPEIYEIFLRTGETPVMASRLASETVTEHIMMNINPLISQEPTP